MSLSLGAVCQSERAREREQQQSALKAAWRPIAAGWKTAWWDSIAMPEGVNDEHAFRQGWLSACPACSSILYLLVIRPHESQLLRFAEVKSLAQESLELLRVALFDRRFPALFSLDVFGNIVGMFELNNLGLVVPSPLLQWLDLAQDSGEESAAGSSSSGVPAEICNSCCNILAPSVSLRVLGFYWHSLFNKPP